MGRWAQRRVRGGGPPPPSPLPHIISVVGDTAENVLVTFDAPLTFHGGIATDIGSFTINGVSYISTTLNDATSIIISFAAVVNDGDVWALNYSPNAWEDELVQLGTGNVSV